MKNQKMNARLIGLMMIFVLVMMTMGCQPKLTPKETLQKIQDISLAQKNYSATFEGQMDMTFEGDIPPEASPYMEMFKNIKFSGDMQMKDTDKLADLAMHYAVDMNGMGMKLEAYFDGDKMIIKYPILPQYIVVDLDELLTKVSEGSELPEGMNYPSLIADLEMLSNTWVPGFNKKVLESTDESSLELIDSYEFIINGETTKSKAIKITMTAETMLGMMNAAIDQAKESQELYDVVKKYDTTGELESFDMYQAVLEEAKVQLATELKLDSVEDAMKNMTYSYVIGYDKKYNATMMAMDMNMAIDDEATAMKSTVHMRAVYQLNYDAVEVVIPEINDQNSLSIIEMMGGMLDSYDTTYEGDLGDLTDEVPFNYMLEDQIVKIDDLHEAVSELADLSRIDSVLEANAMDDYLDIQYIYFATADGKMYMWPSEELPGDYDPTQRPFYTEALDQEYYIPELYSDMTTNKTIQTVAKQVIVNDVVIGVVGIDFAVE